MYDWEVQPAMEQYSRIDPYSRSRYDQGIDSKIVVMGNSGVGKTSLLHRYTQNKFDPKNTTSTSGAFFVTKKVYVNGLKVRLQLWDTAGQERFRSMAPMYYRGANAALLLYDITNASTFEDIRGWLEELKKNCPPELIIYIVGSKADLHRHRQVTPDLARLSLHNWFPPPKPPTPPPPPPPSTLSYIRPRFTSFPGLRSSTSPSPPTPTSPETPAYLDLPPNRSSALQRSKSSMAQIRPRTAGSLTRSNTSTGTRTPQSSRFGGSPYGPGAGWNDDADTNSNSIDEADEDALDTEDGEREWGLKKGMELFEVSAKDDIGIQNLFDHLISAIILRKDAIEQENELKKRDSVFLSNASTPTWAAQADEEEARQKAQRSGSWNCC
ncbi:P-loop containing nucleoside triphosphate hydrolase protein [Crucibulum laeve]|uniref:P-loop containing nucleoside triphosphate hydrolase protein n=1 Tax=Crucibulum laeve TaxID=68775 RepID=A0A5C3MF83_9AGAR|nr:P-loop containing nucleoside triphosphate hydrolase protein [Crucibulum laeve]